MRNNSTTKNERIAQCRKDEKHHIKRAIEIMGRSNASHNVATWAEISANATLAIYYQAERHRLEVI